MHDNEFCPIDLAFEIIILYKYTGADYYHQIPLINALNSFYGAMQDPVIFYPMFL